MKKLLALTMALAMVLALAACGSSNSGSAAPAASADKSAGAASASGSAASDGDAIPGTEDGVLTVGMECAYAPYNWTQMRRLQRRCCRSSTTPAAMPTATTS